MRFSLAILAVSAFGSGMAAPGTVPQDISPRTINEAEFFNLEAAKCSILKCIALIDAAEEIADAIDNGDVKAVIKAVGGSVDKLCSCAGCIKPLEKFLEKHSVC